MCPAEGAMQNPSLCRKNADLMDYRHATGLEALFGYLYLKGEKESCGELFKLEWQKN